MIVYENLQTAGYFKTPFGVTSVLSVLLIFGPPRIVEELLVTDFTSRVHLKEDEIMEYLQKGKEKSVKTINTPFSQKCTGEEEDLLRKIRFNIVSIYTISRKYILILCCTPNFGIRCCFDKKKKTKPKMEKM